MQKLTTATVQELLAVPTTPKVTIYMPLETSAAPPNLSENQIRFKNLIHKAVEELGTVGDESKLGKVLCDKLDEVNGNPDFWKDKPSGILICAAPGFLEMYMLPIDTEEYVSVDDNFHLAPVFALLADNREFYLLAIARHNPKIYKGDMYGLSMMDIGLPVNINSGLNIDEPNQKSENQGSAVGTSMQTGWYNGRGGARDPIEADVARYQHLIDTTLLDNLDRSIPVILAGIDAETAEFKSISKYPKILHGTIAGSHSETHPEELFNKAWPIIHEELVQPMHDAALEEYSRLAGANPERVARDQDSINEAAEQGRIDKLLTSISRDTTDTVQDNMESVIRITFPEGGKSKSLNDLAMKVWQMSGKVIGLLPSQMPHNALMVARLRY